ncbi:MAG: TrkA family potassium uptake protein, partial [Clostridia bacterium]
MKSILVIGMGRFGRHLAHKMQELGNDIMVIDKEASIIEQIASDFTDAHVGDCTNQVVLKALGVSNFDICFVTIGEDFQASLVITSLLKTFNAKYIVAKAQQDIQADLLRQIGADEIVYPEREIAEKLAIRHNAKNIFDFIELTSEYAIYEIPILPQWINGTISSLNIRNKYKINIIAVKNENTLKPMPGVDYVFKENDHVVV